MKLENLDRVIALRNILNGAAKFQDQLQNVGPGHKLALVIVSTVAEPTDDYRLSVSGMVLPTMLVPDVASGDVVEYLMRIIRNNLGALGVDTIPFDGFVARGGPMPGSPTESTTGTETYGDTSFMSRPIK